MHAAPVDLPTRRPELSLPRGKTVEHGKSKRPSLQGLFVGSCLVILTKDLD